MSTFERFVIAATLFDAVLNLLPVLFDGDLLERVFFDDEWWWVVAGIDFVSVVAVDNGFGSAEERLCDARQTENFVYEDIERFENTNVTEAILDEFYLLCSNVHGLHELSIGNKRNYFLWSYLKHKLSIFQSPEFFFGRRTDPCKLDDHQSGKVIDNNYEWCTRLEYSWDCNAHGSKI